MKKLMIAAAAAAMGSGAFAQINYNPEWTLGAPTNRLFEAVEMNSSTNALGATNINNIVEIDKLQIVTYKAKAASEKFFCLNNEENEAEKFYKPSAKSTEKNAAVDGAIYYDASKGWTTIRWSKNKDQLSSFTGGVAMAVFCYADKGGKKVWGAFAPTLEETYKRVDGVIQQEAKEILPGVTNNVDIVLSYNAKTDVYAEIDVEKKQAKSLKSLGDTKITLKTYKDEAARDKAIEKLVKKFEKAGGKF